MFKFFKKKKKDEMPDIYHFQFHLSFPVSNGATRETGIVNIVVPGLSEKQAREKVDQWARKKVQVVIKNVSKN